MEVVSDISELDGSSGIKNIFTGDRLNLGGLQIP